MFNEKMYDELEQEVYKACSEYPNVSLGLLEELRGTDLCALEDLDDILYDKSIIEILENYSWIDTNCSWVDLYDEECYYELELPNWACDELFNAIVLDLYSETEEDICPSVVNYIDLYTSLDLKDVFKHNYTVETRGSCIGWKKAYLNQPTENAVVPTGAVLVKLFIPATAQRTQLGLDQKNRCEYAEVLGIYDLEGNELDCFHAFSGYDFDFKYVKGFKVFPCNGFDENLKLQCGGGIHYFEDIERAKNY